MTLKGIILGISVTLSFLFAADRAYNFYYKNVPVASEGECLSLDPAFEGGKRNKGIVLGNDDDSKTSIVMVEMEDGISFLYVFEYSTLRELHAKKISCDESP